MTRFRKIQTVSILLLITLPAFAAHATTTAESAPANLQPFQFDFDADGKVGSTDLLCFLEMWGLRDVATPTPTATETPSDGENPFQGTYQGHFTGAAAGTATITIDAMGSATGSSTSGQVRSTVEGAISLDGDFFSHLRESGQIIGIVFGKFTGDHGSGQWRDFEGESGSWNMTRSR